MSWDWEVPDNWKRLQFGVALYEAAFEPTMFAQFLHEPVLRPVFDFGWAEEPKNLGGGYWRFWFWDGTIVIDRRCLSGWRGHWDVDPIVVVEAGEIEP